MALLERSQNVLDTYQSHSLHSTGLRAEMQARMDEATLKLSEDLTQHTNSSAGYDATSAFVQHDSTKLAADVSEQEAFMKQIKFLWAESNNKRKFVAHVMDSSSVTPSGAACTEAEEGRLRAKKALKEWKNAAQEKRVELAKVTKELDSELGQLTPQLDSVQGLTRQVRGQELELASLVNGRPASERITPAEAEIKLEDQVSQLRTSSSQLEASRAQLAASQAELAALKKEVGELGQERAAATRAAEHARKTAKDVDGSLGKTYAWLQTNYALLSALIGVSSIECPSPDCMRITYASTSSQQPGCTLLMHFNKDGLSKAELEHSAHRIDGLVEEAKRTGDVRLLINGVRKHQMSSE